MLSIAALSEPSGAARYFVDHQEVDYYVDGETSAGQWTGEAARDLGLERDVSQAALIAVLEGLHPSGGFALVSQALGTHRPGWDCTFSAPKSVSILQALAPTSAAEKLTQAHHGAVRAALGILEREALVARRGRGGAVHERAAGLICATFTHHLSRNLDPQLHTHCLVPNLAPRADGTFGAIESRALYQWKMSLGAIYRAELAERVRALGYSVEEDGSSFRIAGVPKAAEKAFSTRRQEIETALAQAGESSSRRAEAAALRTRSHKVAVNGIDLDSRWDRQLQAVDMSRSALLTRVAEAYRDRDASMRVRQRDAAAVLRDLTEQQSVFYRRDIYKRLALDAQISGGGLDQLEVRVKEVTRHAEAVRLQDGRGELCFSTREMLALERRLVAEVTVHAASTEHALKKGSIDRAIETSAVQLSPEQTRAVIHCCSGGDVALVNGIAGSGKSTLARAVSHAYIGAGYRVIGAALSGKAAQSLELGSGIPSQTLHSLISDLKRGKSRLDRRSVVVLDEAAMVGSRLMARLHAHVRRSGSKLVLVGDARQLQPIEAGGIYNTLLQRVGCVSMTTIRRQREAWAADAVKDVAAGRAERVLATFEEKGLLVTDKDRDKLQDCLVRDWVDVTANGGFYFDAIMLAGTRADVAALNRKARDVLREHEKLSGEELTSDNDKPWAARDRILFQRNSRLLGVRNGDLGTVRSVAREADGLHFIVDLDNGSVVRFGADYPHIDHGYAVTVHKAQGSTVENAFVLVSEQMLDREWTYVSLSRSRGQTRIYCPDDLQIDLAHAMNRSRQKDTSLDYRLEDVAELEAEPD
jgi:Ti-type conjugative transfer relaxase TraA